MPQTNMKIKQAVIFAGGIGERLKPFTIDNPKPMYPINGKPFMEYLINQIKSFGIKDIIILLGYLHEKVEEYFGDGKKFGVNIRYVVTEVSCDTEFRLKAAKDLLDDDFLMMYCDNICPINFERLCDNYFKHGALIELTVYDNNDNWTKSNIIIDSIDEKLILYYADMDMRSKFSEPDLLSGKVTIYDKKRTTPNLKYVDIGYAIVSKKVLTYMSEENENFEAVVYPKILKENKLYATVSRHRYYSIGSFERIKYTEKYLSNQKYIFLDRDGTTNIKPKKSEYICKPEDFIWIDGAKEAIKKLNDEGYFIILISNQAGIARGVMTEENFQKVQKKMESDLKVIDAHIDAVYFCPHGWDENCDCRKPKPGMLYKAQKDYSIDLTKCVMIGDDDRDIETASNADMRGIKVDDKYRLIDAVNDLIRNNN